MSLTTSPEAPVLTPPMLVRALIVVVVAATAWASLVLGPVVVIATLFSAMVVGPLTVTVVGIVFGRHRGRPADSASVERVSTLMGSTRQRGAEDTDARPGGAVQTARPLGGWESRRAIS